MEALLSLCIKGQRTFLSSAVDPLDIDPELKAGPDISCNPQTRPFPSAAAEGAIALFILQTARHRDLHLGHLFPLCHHLGSGK